MLQPKLHKSYSYLANSKSFILLILILSIGNLGHAQRISAEITLEKLYQGKKTVSQSQLYIDLAKTKTITTQEQPPSISLTNEFGEMQLYRSDLNEVYRINHLMYSANNELLYYLLKHREYNMGLPSSGCRLVRTEREGSAVLTFWSPKHNSEEAKNTKEIKLVFEDDKPVYMGYIKKNGVLSKELYYYDYQTVVGLPIPTKITEKVHLGKLGTMISRKTYRNISTQNHQDKMFDFKVPVGAKLVDMQTPKIPELR